MWVFPVPPETKTAEDKWAEKVDEYPHQVGLGADGPNPKLVAGNMDLDLIYIKRGDSKIYGFKTREDAERFAKKYGAGEVVSAGTSNNNSP